jgi:leucyl-tRNA synthetase
LHLLYARFWHKVLFDRGHVFCAEPFQKLVNQGMILGETQYHVDPAVAERYRDKLSAVGVTIASIKTDEGDDAVLMNAAPAGGKPSNLSDDQVEKRKGVVYFKGTDLALSGRADKMSKSRGNVVNPDDVVERYGADSLRLYEMFMGPLEMTKPWSMNGVEGVYRFLSRVWRLFIDDRSEAMRLSDSVQDVEPDRETQRALHHTIKRVTEELDAMRFNTAIAAMMEFSNHLTPLAVRPRKVLEPFVLVLAPFAPHLGEELWRTLGHQQSLTYEPWPKYDPELVKAAEVEVPVQVNGRHRSTLTVPAETDDEALKTLALADEKVKTFTAGKELKRVIVARRKGIIVNIVVNE